MLLGGLPELTKRERDVLRLLSEGVSGDDLASRLHIAPSSVRRHVRRVAAKLSGGGAAVLASSRIRSLALLSRRDLDGLTGLASRVAGERILATETGRASRSGVPLSVLILHLDDLVAARERGGRPAAAQLLRSAARQLTGLVRRTDWPVRWSRSELVVVLPGGDQRGADSVAVRLRTAGAGIGASCGAAQWRPGEAARAVVERAAQAADFDRMRRQADRSIARAAQRGT